MLLITFIANLFLQNKQRGVIIKRRVQILQSYFFQMSQKCEKLGSQSDGVERIKSILGKLWNKV